MSSRDIAIAVSGLSKAYTIRHKVSRDTLAEELLHVLRRPFRRQEKETFWALEDINLEIRKGDVVGLIGRNGAGKSTLLKILSRITEPTTGQIDLYGRVGSLLEVGTGFHPELTGRENIYLNGAILGMRRSEISRQFDAIVEFAGVEQFLDTPVKRYSSGMYVRLAFAVAAHMNTDILLVDEVLAVGDTGFQKKCLGKMGDVAESGRTVIFVSHQLQSVRTLCQQAVYLQEGRVKLIGDVSQVIETYTADLTDRDLSSEDPKRRTGTGQLRLTSMEPRKELFTCDEDKEFEFTIERVKPYTGKYFISIVLIDEHGLTVAMCDSRLTDHWIDASDEYRGRFTLRTPWLRPGRYHFNCYICSAGVIDGCQGICPFRVQPAMPYAVPLSEDVVCKGAVLADFHYDAVPSPRAKFDDIAPALSSRVPS